ncbi:MAG: multiple sugar transport system ATP-binding protein [Rhodospirillaceae bacterium]|jgi:multiple sugar transport system ATP-binding protein|nr:multiple sugar transport system ATP-binding protein [Rhodospirillaceae bacterium]
MMTLEVQGLSKRFGEIQVLDDVSLGVDDGEFFVILGPTNAGKSTLLKTIAGLHQPEDGSIAIKGRNMRGVLPKDRGVSLLFQNIALFPTMTGFDNIAFPLRAAGVNEAKVDRRVREVAALLKIDHILDRHPRTYSGGEQQRAAIGRSIAHPANLLMLDEPLSNLDARIRILLRLEFKRLHKEQRQSVIYVTHDQSEAMSLSTRVGVLVDGRFQQIGTPDEIYQRPRNRFLAEFIGLPPMNILECEMEGGAGESPMLIGPGFRVDATGIGELAELQRLPKQIALGVRPEEIRVSGAFSAETPHAAEVTWVEHLGARRVLDLRLGGRLIKATVPRDRAIAVNHAAWIGFTAKPFRLLNQATGEFFR